ncbi:autotransporter outer membrane beta-barrel domain-containing protein [Neisseria sp. Ec49-e6-T10]|uniref:autotransporter outer membrane beta-barrel domain-containing protein n=1 Tax=Neisseria sp. Ec49-e6-T10 TaxID=3140744 RepID=UPI003EBAAA53
MFKVKPLVAELILLLSSCSVYAAAPTVTVSDDGTTITYQGGTVNGAIVESGNIKKLVVNGAELNNGNTSLRNPSLISLGGTNGSDTSNRDYGNLEVEVDKDTKITANNGTGGLSGIYVRTDTVGSLSKVTSGATINMTAPTSFVRGILVENSGGNSSLDLTDSSDITINGGGSIGVSVSAKNNAQIVNLGKITLNGDYGMAISAVSAAGQIRSTGTITTTGLSNTGISFNSQGTSGDTPSIIAGGNITIGQDYGNIITNGASGSRAIVLTAVHQDLSRIVYDDKQSSININAGSTGSLSAGILHTNNGGGRNVIIANMDSINVKGDNSAAIIAESKGGSGETDIKVNGNINMLGANTYGMKVSNINTGGAISVGHTGNIDITGTSNASNIGISAVSATGTSIVSMAGSMNIKSDNAKGIIASATSNGSASIVFTDPNQNIRSSLNIESLGNSTANDLIGLTAQSKGGATNSSQIQVSYVDSLIVTGEGNTTVAFADGTLGTASVVNISDANSIIANSLIGQATAISARSSNQDTTAILMNSKELKAISENGRAIGVDVSSANNGKVNVLAMNTALIQADSVDGIAIRTVSDYGENNVSIFGDSKVQGGRGINGAGIDITAGTGNVNLTNFGGNITSDNDQAIIIRNSRPVSGVTTVMNTGTVLGYVTLNGNNVTVNNEQGGIFALQNFGPNGQVKDTVHSIIGSDTTGVFNNRGTVKFADKNFTGSYANLNTAAVINVGTFNNSGVIDLSTNGLVRSNAPVHSDYIGNTLTINGNYVSDGGQIIVNTLIGQNNLIDGKSDRLIVNGDVQTGVGGATFVSIRPTTDSINTLISNPDYGIKIIEVNGSSSDDAFTLKDPVYAGKYEYVLTQAANATHDQSWYLSNTALPEPEPEPEPEPNPEPTPNPGGNGSEENKYINPSVGAYLANQTAATELFRMSLFNRLTGQSAQEIDATQKHTWFYSKMAYNKYNTVQNALNNRSQSYMFKLGGDLVTHELKESGYVHVGVMAGYGYDQNTSTSKKTGSKVKGHINGYNLGGYLTYFAHSDIQSGLYIDTWTQMSWFKNEVKGRGVFGTNTYDSTLWSNSIEIGYGLPIVQNKSHTWLITPQQQFVYNVYDADSHYDQNGLSVTNHKANGLISRTGLRLHGVSHSQSSMIEPFVEVNWVNSSAKYQLSFNGSDEHDGLPENRYEAKLGLQGNLTKQWGVSADVTGTWGANSYKAYQAQFNVHYIF